MSFAQRISASQTSQLYFVTAKDGQFMDAYYYVRVDKGKERRFEKDIAGGHIDLADYGTILASGYGSQPSQSIKQQLKDEHGFDVE